MKMRLYLLLVNRLLKFRMLTLALALAVQRVSGMA